MNWRVIRWAVAGIAVAAEVLGFIIWRRRRHAGSALPVPTKHESLAPPDGAHRPYRPEALGINT